MEEKKFLSIEEMEERQEAAVVAAVEVAVNKS
jgi:hypothetical protein